MSDLRGHWQPQRPFSLRINLSIGPNRISFSCLLHDLVVNTLDLSTRGPGFNPQLWHSNKVLHNIEKQLFCKSLLSSVHAYWLDAGATGPWPSCSCKRRGCRDGEVATDSKKTSPICQFIVDRFAILLSASTLASSWTQKSLLVTGKYLQI